VIGRYQIVDRLGEGGMGSLYRAWDPILERQIAIKLLRDANDHWRERFAREARSVARLRHRNIVTIFDVGEQDGHPFIAMEYIQGQTLAELIRRGAPISVLRKLQIIDELCDGLAFAHKAGIVHRDVKPPNVMVEHDGTVKILDFGIVRLAESCMTQTGMMIGTVNYMSPEQLTGRPVDLRSDIFAVGAVLYELLSCRQAFHGGVKNGIFDRILHEPPPPLELCPDLDLDPEIVRIVDQALQKDPAARYQDLSSMRDDLQRVGVRVGFVSPAPVRCRITDSDTINLQAPTALASRPATPRRGANREDLARLRASQIAALLEHAQQALANGEFEMAMAAAEQALLLDVEDLEALDLLEQARSALEERRSC
jgi:serine/threonine-protein kinase